jgi:hypothetical protein
MTSRRAGDDRPGGSAPSCALANGVSHELKIKEDNLASKTATKIFHSHDATFATRIEPPTFAEAARASVKMIYTEKRYGLTNTLLAVVSSTSAPYTIFEQLNF